MRPVLALTITLVISGVAIYENREPNGISTIDFVSMLVFAIIVGAAIAFHDCIRSIKFGGSGVELFERQAEQVANKEISRIRAEVDKQTESIQSLTEQSAQLRKLFRRLSTAKPVLLMGKDSPMDGFYISYTDDEGRQYVPGRDEDGNEIKRFISTAR